MWKGLCAALGLSLFAQGAVAAIETPFTLDKRKISVYVEGFYLFDIGWQRLYLVNESSKWVLVTAPPQGQPWMRFQLSTKTSKLVLDRHHKQDIVDACSPRQGCPPGLISVQGTSAEADEKSSLAQIERAVGASNIIDIAAAHIEKCMQDNVSKLKEQEPGMDNPRAGFNAFQNFYSTYSPETAAQMAQTADVKEKQYVSRMIAYNRDFLSAVDSDNENQQRQFMEKYRTLDPDNKIALLMVINKNLGPSPAERKPAGFGGGRSDVPTWCPSL